VKISAHFRAEPDMGAKKPKISIYSKLMNFGPHILTLLESTRQGLQGDINLWAEIKKRRRYGDGAKNGKPLLSRK